MWCDGFVSVEVFYEKTRQVTTKVKKWRMWKQEKK